MRGKNVVLDEHISTNNNTTHLVFRYFSFDKKWLKLFLKMNNTQCKLYVVGKMRTLSEDPHCTEKGFERQDLSC